MLTLGCSRGGTLIAKAGSRLRVSEPPLPSLGRYSVRPACSAILDGEAHNHFVHTDSRLWVLPSMEREACKAQAVNGDLRTARIHGKY